MALESALAQGGATTWEKSEKGKHTKIVGEWQEMWDPFPKGKPGNRLSVTNLLYRDERHFLSWTVDSVS